MAAAPIIIRVVRAIAYPSSARIIDAVAPKTDAAVRPTAVQATVARVVAVHELAALLEKIRSASAASSVTATLRERCCRCHQNHDHRKQQSDRSATELLSRVHKTSVSIFQKPFNVDSCGFVARGLMKLAVN